MSVNSCDYISNALRRLCPQVQKADRFSEEKYQSADGEASLPSSASSAPQIAQALRRTLLLSCFLTRIHYCHQNCHVQGIFSQ